MLLSKIGRSRPESKMTIYNGICSSHIWLKTSLLPRHICVHFLLSLTFLALEGPLKIVFFIELVLKAHKVVRVMRN